MRYDDNHLDILRARIQEARNGHMRIGIQDELEKIGANQKDERVRLVEALLEDEEDKKFASYLEHYLYHIRLYMIEPIIYENTSKNPTNDRLSIEGVNYSLSCNNDHKKNLSPWNVYNIIEDSKSPTKIMSGKYKVHISIKREAENIEKANKTIIPILAKYKVKTFKMIYSGAKDIGINHNPDGKELTIYMQLERKESLESNPLFWQKVLREIENSLEANKIEKGNIPMSDIQLPGSKGYIFFRNAYNIFGKYVRAQTLKECGFTRQEASNIGKYSDVFKKINLGESTKKETKEIKKIKSIKKKFLFKEVEFNPIMYRHIKDKFLLNLDNEIWKSSARLLANAIIDYREITLLEYFNKIIIEEHPKQDSSVHKSCLYRIIEKSAAISTQIYGLLPKEVVPTISDRDNKIDVGNIIPALYNYYAVPYAFAANDKNWTPDMMKRNLEKEKPDFVNEDELTREIVKASLREKGQILYDNPKFINGLDESEIDNLINKIVTQEKENNQQSNIALDTRKNKYTEISR